MRLSVLVRAIAIAALAGTVHCDRTTPPAQPSAQPGVQSGAESPKGGVVNNEGIPLLDNLTDADVSKAPHRVRLLGLTEPAKDLPHLRLRDTSIALHGDFDEQLWRDHDRLVVVLGVAEHEPVRDVPTMDENGLAIQTRGRVGGWSLSKIEGVAPPTLEDLVGRDAWVDGIAVDGPAVRAPATTVIVKGQTEWSQELRGQRVRVEGAIHRAGPGYAIQHTRSYVLELDKRVGQEVELAGRCWSLNDQWWFSWRGQRIAVEPKEGEWPPRQLPSGGHGELARLVGRLVRAPGGESGFLVQPREVRALEARERFAAAW